MLISSKITNIRMNITQMLQIYSNIKMAYFPSMDSDLPSIVILQRVKIDDAR